MSIQKFNAVQRQAIWLAYSKKCAYSGDLIDIRNMQIDHIVPETINANHQEYSKIASRLNLPKGFDINGYENLLPCSQEWNLLKGNAVFSDSQIQYFLGIASAKKVEIEKNIIKIENQINNGKAAMMLQSLLEANKLSAEEVADILQKNNNKPNEVFKLIESLKLYDTDEIVEIRKSDITQLRRKQIRLGANDHIDGVELYKSDTDTRYVKTCEQYDEAVKDGYYALTTYAMKMATFFEHQCGLLTALSNATLPDKSFIDEPRVGITDLDLLPISFFPVMGKEEPFETQSSYQEQIEKGNLVIKRLKSNLLLIEQKAGMGQQLIEVARADFNGDGIEDILVFEYCYATHGTMGFGFTSIITRTSKDGMFERITS